MRLHLRRVLNPKMPLWMFLLIAVWMILGGAFILGIGVITLAKSVF